MATSRTEIGLASEKMRPVVKDLIRVARAAVEAYDLPDADVRAIRLTNNAVFEVVAGHSSARRREATPVRYALRLHRPGYRTLAHIRSELAFLATLADEVEGTRIDVPRPIASRSGEFVVEVEAVGEDGVRSSTYCDLLAWIDGRVLKHGGGLGIVSSALLGEGLARIHNAAEHFEQPPGFHLTSWDAETMFTDVSPFEPGPMKQFLAPAAWALFSEVAGLTQDVFEELDRLSGQRGIVHNDYVLINSLFRRSRVGWRLGILDFDDLGIGYFLYDLAPLLGNLFDYPDAYRSLRRSFLDGYRRVRSLPPALEAHLPVLMAARHAVTLTWLAAKQRRGETDLPIERHVEIRVAEMARCLTLT